MATQGNATAAGNLLGFAKRWLTVTVWFATSFFVFAFILGVMSDAAVDEWGVFIVLVWLALAYVVGNWLWHR